MTRPPLGAALLGAVVSIRQGEQEPVTGTVKAFRVLGKCLFVEVDTPDEPQRFLRVGAIDEMTILEAAPGEGRDVNGRFAKRDVDP